VKRNGVEYVECERANCPFVHLVVNGRTYAEWRHPAAPVISPFVRRAMAAELPGKEYAR